MAEDFAGLRGTLVELEGDSLGVGLVLNVALDVTPRTAAAVTLLV